ncbi:aquaporin-2 [Xyrichtys novacula]|uniref:Aquaporin-2 n=1 Tax=Xyrichtys novacula TaxID=13765 RepID=A0AAV1GQE2_XYRNO|nr:aquaporin-2 [Xyrichtys novacula]
MLVRHCQQQILSDVWTRSCLRHFLLEFIGTALFLLISLSAVLILPAPTGKLQLDPKMESGQGSLCHLCNISNQSNLSERMSARNQCNQNIHLTPLSVQSLGYLQVALVFGLSVAVAAICVGGEVSLNPAVTVAMALNLRLHLWRALLYVIGQLLGGVASAALLLGLTRDVTPALNKVAPGVQLHLAVAIEALAAFQLVLVVLATVDANLSPIVCNLLVGLSVSLGHLMAVGATGCGMNPARSFGPAIITLDFNNHWVFWAGPGLGACLAVICNDLLLRPRWHHLRDWWSELKQLYVMTNKEQQVVLSHCP